MDWREGIYVFWASKEPVRTEEEWSEEATVYRGLVHDNGIFLVISRITGNCHNRVLTEEKIETQGWYSDMIIKNKKIYM